MNSYKKLRNFIYANGGDLRPTLGPDDDEEKFNQKLAQWQASQQQALTSPAAASNNTAPALGSTITSAPNVNVSLPQVNSTPAGIDYSINKNSAPSRNVYHGDSIVDYLKSIGVDSSKENRAKIAAQQGITNYSTSAEGNTALLQKLEQAKAINASDSLTVGSPEYIKRVNDFVNKEKPSTNTTSGGYKVPTQQETNDYWNSYKPKSNTPINSNDKAGMDDQTANTLKGLGAFGAVGALGAVANYMMKNNNPKAATTYLLNNSNPAANSETSLMRAASNTSSRSTDGRYATETGNLDRRGVPEVVNQKQIPFLTGEGTSPFVSNNNVRPAGSQIGLDGKFKNNYSEAENVLNNRVQSLYRQPSFTLDNTLMRENNNAEQGLAHVAEEKAYLQELMKKAGRTGKINTGMVDELMAGAKRLFKRG